MHNPRFDCSSDLPGQVCFSLQLRLHLRSAEDRPGEVIHTEAEGPGPEDLRSFEGPKPGNLRSEQELQENLFEVFGVQRPDLSQDPPQFTGLGLRGTEFRKCH